MLIRISFFAIPSLAVMALMAPAHAKKCPRQVKSAIEHAYPGGQLESCKSVPAKSGQADRGKRESEIRYQAELDTREAKEVGLILSPDGAILAAREAKPTDSLPDVIVTAFETEHPDATMNTATVQTDSSGALIFEIAFLDKGYPVEASYDQNGKKIKEEVQQQSMREASTEAGRSGGG